MNDSNQKEFIHSKRTMASIWDSVDHDIRHVFDDLDLTQQFPNKITIQKAREFGKSDASEKSHIPWSFLENVLALRYKGRGDFFQIHKGAANVENSLMENIDEFDWDEDKSTQKDVKYSFHDIRVAVFLCCDNICKKLLAQKLHMSHLSIPLLLPDITERNKFVLQLWALRGMTDFEGDIGFDMHIPIVSFISANGSPIMKTKILNTLLCDESFDTFFDIELEKSRMNGANVEMIFSDGVIDAACFQPSKCVCTSPEKCSCTFKKLLMFLNLYGTSGEGDFKTQQELICKISTLVVIVVDAGQIKAGKVIDNITELINESKQALIVFTKDQKSSLQGCKKGFVQIQNVLKGIQKNTKVQVLFDRKNGSVFLSERTRRTMKQVINEIIDAKDEDDTSLKDLFGKLNITNVITDQDERDCSLGKKKAEEIYFKIQKNDMVGMKEKVLPLQCYDLWQTWSKIERRIKSETPEENESYEQFTARLHAQQKKLREKQIVAYKYASNEIMQMFCSTITRLTGSSKSYFIEWLSIFVNDLSSKHMDQLRKKLSSLREDKTKAAISGVDDSHFDKESKELEDKIKNDSFNIKHFFREVGQIYEAFNALKTSSNISLSKEFNEEQLCLVVARLFASGFPLEILDCKAKQIPMTFIKSVFGYVKGMIPGKVFILSVIGIQSSGKSTLLNAMFGTQFSTSVGLCTEGVNAQLIPMPSHIHSPEYKYIMLIDTKGLRSTDNEEILLNSYSRDNELATFLFGISDLTMITMKGESKTDIDNILQIVIHALLNIKSVNIGMGWNVAGQQKSADKGLRLGSRCLFIHHNVDASGAQEKLTIDNTKFKDKLDQVTAGVAEMLGVPDVTKFSDIIKFDVDDIKYFPNLWRGLPPMASISIGYSAKVKEVKDHILKDIIPNHQLPKLDIERFSTWLKDVWDAIQSQDFVFCFRNHVEINAHMKLETVINNLRWDLNKTAIVTLRGMREDIKKNPDDEETMLNEIKGKMDKAYDAAKTKLDEFFKTTEDGILLREWSVHYDKTLEKLKDEKIESSKKLLFAEIKIQKIKNDTAVRLEKCKNEARQKAITYAKVKLEQGAGGLEKKEELEKSFNDLWNSLKKSITPPDTNDNVGATVRNGLRDMGGLHVTHTEAIRFDEPLEDDFKVEDNHFNKQGKTADERPEFKNINEINNEVTCKIIEEVEKYMDDIRDDILSKSHVEQTVKIVLDNIKRWNNENQEMKLTKQYKTDILVYVAKHAMPFYRKMQEVYRNKIDVRQELEEFKVEIRTRFMDTIKQIDQERTEATLFCNELIRLIKRKVDKDLVEILPEDIRDRNHIMTSKKEFLNKILKDLLKEDMFNRYMEFLDHTSQFFVESLRKYVNEYLFDQKAFSQHAIKRSELITSHVLAQIKRNASALTEGSDIMAWMETLQKLAGILPEIRESTKHVMDSLVQNNVNANMFYTYLVNSVEKIPNTLRDTYSKMTKLNPECDKQIFDQLLEHVQGCQKKCPFCQVLCTSIVHGHEKECRNPQHYPIGMQGYKKQNKVVIETCNSLVGSSEKFRFEGGQMKISVGRKILNFLYHLDTSYNQDIVSFRKYKKVYQDWDIEVNKSFDGSLYWKRLLAKFTGDLVRRYGGEAPEIPQEWNDIKKEEAIISLD